MKRLLLLLLLVATLATAACAARRNRVLLLLAHPDDEVLMAGTLAQAAEAGHEIQAVYVTSGDAGQDRSGRGLSGEALAAARERETRLANKALGFAQAPRFLGFPDGEVFAHRDRVRAAALQVARDVVPDVIMALGADGVTGHPDHQATYLAARQVRARLGRRVGFLAVLFTESRAALFDEAWGIQGVKGSNLDRVVPVPSRFRRKRVEVLRLHTTQFPEAMVETYRTRTMGEDGLETFEGDAFLTGVPGLEP